MQRQHSHLPNRRGRTGSLLLAGALVFGAAACGDDDDNDTDDTIVVPNDSQTGVSLPRPTTEGTGPLDTFMDVDTSGDVSDGTVLGDPMEPVPNSLQVPDLTGP